MQTGTGLPTITEAMRPFLAYDAPTIAIQHVQVIDGTGGPCRPGQTVLIHHGMIAFVESDGAVAIPADAIVIDGTGMSVLPGLVQMHEHMWMAGPAGLLSVPVGYARLYLAAGVTSIRSVGSYNNYADLALRRSIESGASVGPWMDLSVFMGGIFGMPPLKPGEETRRYLDFWLDSGFTSVKAYRRTNRAALESIVMLAHERGVKVTAHLGATTYSEAAELGIDNIEHGFIEATDFMAARVPDICPETIQPSVGDLDPFGPQATELIAKLVERGVALTSTLAPWAHDVAENAKDWGADLLAPDLRKFSLQYFQEQPAASHSCDSDRKRMRHSALMEREFMRAGGLLLSGSDPAVESGAILAGFGSVRQMELMVENGFTPLEAIRISTLNGAIYLDRADMVGSIAPGMQADLLLVHGDPATAITDLRKVYLVFKQGLAYDPAKLKTSVRGTVGLG